jgi:surface polysaccharide O-acyltransferase-like enzyme
MLMLASYWSTVISWFGGSFPRDTLTVVTHFLPYVGYYLLGYVLHSSDWSSYLVKLAWLSVGVWMMAVVMTQLMYGMWGYSSRSMMLEDYASVNVVALTTAVFVLVRSWYSRQRFVNHWWLKSIARSSFGIYLMHLLILEWGVKYIRVTLGFNVWIAIILGGVLAFGISWLVTEVMGSRRWLSGLVGR